MNIRSISLENGKYIIVLTEKTCTFHALRYGQPWRDLTGDNLILSLFHKVEELKEELQKLSTKNKCSYL